MKKKIIHYIIEIFLMIVCLGIGNFEDLYIFHAFVITTAYNLLYVLLLRKLTGEKFLASICNIILIWAVGIATPIVIYAICILFTGYTDYGLFGMGPGYTYYGLEAWTNNLFIIIFGPVALINIVYIVVYCIVKKKRKNKLK